MRKNNQTTIVKPVKLSGVGIHSGRKVELIFKPAAANFGYAFCRTDLEGKPIFVERHKSSKKWSEYSNFRACFSCACRFGNR